MDKTSTVLWFGSLLILVLPAVAQTQDQQDFLDLEDDLSPIQILKKGFNPRNCPGGFRKRDSSRVKTEQSLSESILPLKNDFMKIVQKMLRNYIEKRQNEAARREIVVDYIPRRILVTGRQDNERR